jgi:hypothetical protein
MAILGRDRPQIGPKSAFPQAHDTTMTSLLRDLGLAQDLNMQRFPDHEAKIHTFPQRSRLRSKRN